MKEGASTIPAALLATLERGGCEYVFHLGDETVRLGAEELLERARRGAGGLAALGVEPGDTVGVLGPNRAEWVVSAFAVWFAGATLVPVQRPLRVRRPDAYREQLLGLLEAAACRRVLVEPGDAGMLPAEVATPWDGTPGGPCSDPPLPRGESPAVIQFTSGSTATPKGALLRHDAVAAQMDALRRLYCYDDGSPRAIANWAPFFHDLGLFASVVQPAFSGATVHQLPTDRFARDPAEWLRTMQATRAAITVAPGAAFASALNAVERRAEKVDLSSLDAACFAAEGIDAEIARRMVESECLPGFRPEALGGTYGLAEAVMGAAFPRAGEGLRVDRIDREALSGTGVAAPAGNGRARLLAASGPPVMELRIWGEGGETPDRHVGEIQLRGRSLMSGYVGAAGADPFQGDWLRTGDLGYLAEGDLFVTGRAKDVMIAMGHNYYPEDFEWAAARIAGVRPGRCVAFGRPGAEEVVLLIEAREGCGSPAFADEVADQVADVAGVRPYEVVLLPPGTVQKTTSGKLRRAAMREAYLSGAL